MDAGPPTKQLEGQPEQTEVEEDEMAEIKQKVKEQIRNIHVLMYSKTTCPFCARVKRLFDVQCVAYTTIELDVVAKGTAIQKAVAEISGQLTVPNVFINGQHFGGCDAITASFTKGILASFITEGTMKRDYFVNHPYDYDLIVIGGGSGGLACAKEAAKIEGTKILCLDYVKPSPVGTSWGLGGTCVNVGCIPKKLMHQASLLGQQLNDARHYGWTFSKEVSHTWTQMVEAIQNYIRSLNWSYRSKLRNKGVKYVNGLAKFFEPHTLLYLDTQGKEHLTTGARIVVAVGGRPRYPDIPGAKEYGITSDDIFSMTTPPGKTLVVGASYVALECAGFLTKLGFDTCCMVRSILLRGFDQEMATMIGEDMLRNKVKFIRKTVPTRIELISEGPPRLLRVHYKNLESGKEGHADFNTVLFAIGRYPDTKDLELEKAGVTVTKNGYIPTVYEQTNVPHIYAIGDVQQGKLELTPLAIQAGRCLARRLFAGDKVNCDYINVPTTVFTPLEYGCIGLAEEDALLIFGKDNIEVYHVHFKPLEFTVADRNDDCYMKLIVNKADNEKVIGLHVISPNAGEITQGYAIAIKMGARKSDFDSTIGIHPTCSENFTTLSITKSSKEDSSADGC